MCVYTCMYTVSPRYIQEAIANAKSLEEVQQLEAMLKAGQIPGDLDMTNHHGHYQGRGGGGGGGGEMEEEDEVED